jgi:hypothetical protein
MEDFSEARSRLDAFHVQCRRGPGQAGVIKGLGYAVKCLTEPQEDLEVFCGNCSGVRNLDTDERWQLRRLIVSGA